MMLRLNDIGKTVDNKRTVLGQINLEISKGQKTGIVGETGSGKTTLLKIIAGLEQPTSGLALFNDEKVLGPNEQLVPGHPSMGYLSQHFELPKFQSVEESIYDPYIISEQDVYELYSACQIQHLLDEDTSALSGGEKQRVALARILVNKPEILLLDEPFSNLDLHHQSIIKEVIDDVETTFGTSVILVSHDPLDVLSWADWVLVMKSGAIVQENTPFNIYNYPADEYVAGLFGKYSLIKPSDWSVSLKNFKQVGDKVIVRPEIFRLSKNLDEGKPGKVIKVMYYGSYEELKVQFNKESIIAKTQIGAFKKDDRVGVTLRDIPD